MHSAHKKTRPRGVEPLAFWFVVKRSIQLSYGRIITAIINTGALRMKNNNNKPDFILFDFWIKVKLFKNRVKSEKWRVKITASANAYCFGGFIASQLTPAAFNGNRIRRSICVCFLACMNRSLNTLILSFAQISKTVLWVRSFYNADIQRYRRCLKPAFQTLFYIYCIQIQIWAWLLLNDRVKIEELRVEIRQLPWIASSLRSSQWRQKVSSLFTLHSTLLLLLIFSFIVFFSAAVLVEAGTSVGVSSSASAASAASGVSGGIAAAGTFFGGFNGDVFAFYIACVQSVYNIVRVLVGHFEKRKSF